MTFPHHSLDREFLAARLTALINWTQRVSEVFDLVMSRVKHLEASQKQQKAQADHESQLMRVIELFMQDDVRACTVMDYVIVFFRLVLAKLRQRGQDFDDVKQLHKALSDDEVAQIFRTVLSKLGFPTTEQYVIRVVLEAMQHRKWPKSQVMTTSPGGDAQISSALLYLRLQRDLESVMSSALQRALCAAHECILTDMAISEDTAQDVNINASDVRKDDAYVDARVKYEDYVSFERGSAEGSSLREFARQEIEENGSDLENGNGAMFKSSSVDSDHMKTCQNLCETFAGSSLSIDDGSSLDASLSAAEQHASVKQLQETFPSCHITSTETNPQAAVKLTPNRLKAAWSSHRGSKTCMSANEIAKFDSTKTSKDVTKTVTNLYQDISHNSSVGETEGEPITAEAKEDSTEKPGQEGCQRTDHLTSNTTTDIAAHSSVTDDENPHENINQSSSTADSPERSADESESPLTIDKSRLAHDPNFYVICYDVASSPTTPAMEDVKSTTNERTERRHRPGYRVPRGAKDMTSAVDASSQDDVTQGNDGRS